jgi:hypothetical protein
LGDVPELHVQALGGPAQHVERPVLGHPLPGHEDALGLTDHVAGPDGHLLALEALGTGERDRCVRGEDHPVPNDVVVEGPRLRRVQAQRADGVGLDEQPTRQDAAHAGPVHGTRSEGGPAVVGREVVDVDGRVVAHGVDARPLPGLRLEEIDEPWELTRRRRRLEHLASQQRDPGVLAPLGRLDRQRADRAKGVLHARFGEQRARHRGERLRERHVCRPVGCRPIPHVPHF